MSTPEATADAQGHSLLERMLDGIERLGNKMPNPAILFLWLCIGVIVLSQILYWFDIKATYQVVEPAPFEHPGSHPVGGGAVIRHLEDMQHGVTGHQDGLPGMTGPAAKDNGCPQTDGVFVEGPEAVEIVGHNGNMADSTRRAHPRCRSART